MNQAIDPASFQRADAVVADSRLIRLAEGIWLRSMAIARGSHAVAAMRRRAEAFERMSTGGKEQCVLVAAATAVVGHVLVAWVLPSAARPNVGLTTLVLIALFIAAVAGVVRRR
jgi:hypothetical protein